MSLLLHLSDLHLAASSRDDLVGDYKIEAIPEDQRQSRLKLLRFTLNALSDWLEVTRETLAAVVITGDVTTRGAPQGFDELPGVLAQLGGALPEPARIVVVPGNHDVAWRTAPGSYDRYQMFLDGVRAKGYVTPLLDGVDYDGATPVPTANPLLVGEDFLIVAINSADYCGILEPLTRAHAQRELDEQLATNAIGIDLAAEIDRLRLYDMPRVSQQQLAGLASLIGSADALPLVRIAAMHHQLVPVRTEEEAKPFESLVNLGEVRSFLADSRIDMVLHGHKHHDRVATDVFVPFDEDRHEHRILVASCGTVGGMIGTGAEIAKLVRIHSELPRLRRVEVLSVPAVSAGRSLRDRIKSVYVGPNNRASPPAAVTEITGTTATDVHERLLELAKTRNGEMITDVVCNIEHGDTALDLPDTYPPIEEAHPDNVGWFAETVQWWQDATRAEGKPFTHGQRLRAWAGVKDQFNSMISALAQDVATSRAIAVLVNPTVDDLADKAVQFPSFSLLHFRIVDNALQCIAMFRKQEMRYWWPINAAEIAFLQNEALQRLHANHERLVAGSIRTYASEAVFSDLLPKVDVPQIDRVAWSEPARLWTIAVAIADTDMPGRASLLADLDALMRDWRPEAPVPPRDGAALPDRGLAVLAEALEVLGQIYSQSSADEAADLVRRMHDENKKYETRAESGSPTKEYQEWRKRELRFLDEFVAVVNTSTVR